MGYDMRIKGSLPEAEATEVAELRAAWDKASEEVTKVREELVKSGDKEWLNSPRMSAAMQKYDETYEAWARVKDPGYFRLNGSGMRIYLGVMEALGLAHEQACPEIDWASLPDYDEGEDAYYEACDQLTGIHPGTDPTIPTFKFSSNDGWLVTPTECQAAVAAWKSHQAAGLPDDLADDDRAIAETPYWSKWIDYLELAANNGGFRVH